MAITMADIEKLKCDWLSDPCWDIYSADGFEQYEDELRAFQKEHETKWNTIHESKESEKNQKAEELGLKGLYRLILQLEEIQGWHSMAISYLAEGEVYKAYRVLQGESVVFGGKL